MNKGRGVKIPVYYSCATGKSRIWRVRVPFFVWYWARRLGL